MQTALIFRERLLAQSETFIAEQAKRLRRYSPVMVGLRRTHPCLQYAQPEILLRDGCSFSDRLAASLYRRFPIGTDFIRRLRAANPSIIHAHFAIDAVQALPIARTLNIPLVVSLHGFDVTSNDGALRMSRAGRHFLQHRQRLFHEATAFICVSKFIRNAALRAGFPESRLHVHYTGIDCERFRAVDVPRDPKLILFVGRLVEKKDANTSFERWRSFSSMILMLIWRSSAMAHCGQGSSHLPLLFQFGPYSVVSKIPSRFRAVWRVHASCVIPA